MTPRHLVLRATLLVSVAWASTHCVSVQRPIVAAAPQTPPPSWPDLQKRVCAEVQHVDAVDLLQAYAEAWEQQDPPARGRSAGGAELRVTRSPARLSRGCKPGSASTVSPRCCGAGASSGKFDAAGLARGDRPAPSLGGPAPKRCGSRAPVPRRCPAGQPPAGGYPSRLRPGDDCRPRPPSRRRAPARHHGSSVRPPKTSSAPTSCYNVLCGMPSQPCRCKPNRWPKHSCKRPSKPRPRHAAKARPPQVPKRARSSCATPWRWPMPPRTRGCIPWPASSP